MKNLIVSILCLLCLIIPWGVYDKYSINTIESYKTTLDNLIIPSIEMGDWQLAQQGFDTIYDDWDQFKSISAYFIDTEAVNLIDGFMAKTQYYILLQDASNAAAESAYLKHHFDFLHENEMPSFGNIF